MRVHGLHDEAGDLYAFEVSMPLGGRRAVTAVIRKLPRAKLVRTPKVLSWFREDSFCEFELSGTRFEILEPFGDNSRYWIGPVGLTTPHPDIPFLMAAFRDA